MSQHQVVFLYMCILLHLKPLVTDAIIWLGRANLACSFTALHPFLKTLVYCAAPSCKAELLMSNV